LGDEMKKEIVVKEFPWIAPQIGILGRIQISIQRAFSKVCKTIKK